MGLVKRLLLAALNQPADDRNASTALAVRPPAPLALPTPYERQGREAPFNFTEIMQAQPPAQSRPRRKKIIVTERITRREW